MLREAANSVRNFPVRIWSGEMLEACRGIGAQFRMVSVWSGEMKQAAGVFGFETVPQSVWSSKQGSRWRVWL